MTPGCKSNTERLLRCRCLEPGRRPETIALLSPINETHLLLLPSVVRSKKPAFVVEVVSRNRKTRRERPLLLVEDPAKGLYATFP